MGECQEPWPPSFVVHHWHPCASLGHWPWLAHEHPIHVLGHSTRVYLNVFSHLSFKLHQHLCFHRSAYDITSMTLERNKRVVCGEGRIGATKGWISVDRGSKATLPLTIPCRVFKSSAKDSTNRSVEITLQGDPRDSSVTRALPTTRAFGGQKAPTAGRQSSDRRMRRF